MRHLNEPELLFWQAYLQTLPPESRPAEPFVEASFAGPRESTDELLSLYLTGRKTAGSSIKEDFIAAGDPLPKVGNFWILLNSREEPGCLLRTEKIVEHKFYDVPPEIAVAEGEGDLSLEHWRRVHRAIYEPHLAEWGLASIADATVLTEYFALVFK
ncbi:MAG: ASCH domain-containing protein [Hamadaea sp.]|uniref:ASCH domain-containing protein n=1 Tax=Hamadaea sp. TaxID=2024425 RepID=UPI0017DA4AE7|nr:ASCH domain-containing protein [Hamadaea sp.]NUT18741.1 ASCH domain-containing protein [Hamadaea sp.]